jgi:rhamnosyltransferase subunit B
MDILLTTLGSAGDVFPFVALGRELRARGHRVSLVTTGYFEEVAESEGLGFHEVGDVNRYDELVNDPRMWQPARGIPILIKDFVLPAVREVYGIIEQAATADTMLVGSSLAYGARIARDSLGLPLVTVHLQPYIFMSLEEPPFPPALAFTRHLPPASAGFFREHVGSFLDRTWGSEVNTLLKELKLPPANGIFTGWFNSPDRVVGLFPEWFCPPAPDWPDNSELAGFLRYDRSGEALDEEVEQYLTAGEPPVVMSPGSAMAHGKDFFSAGVEACRRLGRRALLVTGHSDHLPDPLPGHAAHFKYVPFSQLLPRSAAFLHHGGIGSMSQGMAAGVPQLIMPMNFDQPDNAHRLKKLGGGDFLAPRQFTAGKVTARLEQLLSSDKVAARCRELSGKVDPAAAVGKAADMVENLDHKQAGGCSP